MKMFSDPCIPAETAEAVNSLAQKGRLPQSILLTGGSEKRREQCGAELAAALLCRTPVSGLPCGTCAACAKVKAGSHPDLIRVLPEPDKKTVSIDAVRQLVLDSLYVAPNEAEMKVYLFPAAETLSPVVQNALLKSVEEPPAFVSFLFLSRSREALLETVVSRCTEFPLGGDTADAPKRGEKAALIAAQLADALVTGDAYAILCATAPMAKNRELMKQTAEALTVILRDAMANDARVGFLSGADRQALGLAARYTTPQLLEMKAAMDRISDCAEHNANENLLISAFSAMLTAACRRTREEKETTWLK
ncbi:MAG: hypothetical protein IJT27_03120 [Clostridia bacterium]|nr:hypothetical protein [Clostridia bacterium]